MYKVTAEEVKALREKTGINLMSCKKALIASEGNVEKAIQWLKENTRIPSLTNWR